MVNILDGYWVEIFIKDKKTMKTAPITEMGVNPNPYAIFVPNFITALEKVVQDEFLGEIGKEILKKHEEDKKNDS